MSADGPGTLRWPMTISRRERQEETGEKIFLFLRCACLGLGPSEQTSCRLFWYLWQVPSCAAAVVDVGAGLCAV